MNQSSAFLYYREPAAYWEGALPLGNGRIGAMVYGGTAEETVALNEDTLWSGLPEHAYSKKVFENLPHARALIREHRFTEADSFISSEMLDHDSQSYLPAGTLHFRFRLEGSVSDYVRSLDLENALAVTSFRAGGTLFRREMFASYPDQLLVIRIGADHPGAVSFNATFSSEIHGTSAGAGDLPKLRLWAIDLGPDAQKPRRRRLLTAYAVAIRGKDHEERYPSQGVQRHHYLRLR